MESVGRTSRAGPVEYCTFQLDDNSLKPLATLKAKVIAYPVRTDVAKPYDPDERMCEDRKLARKLRRRRLLRVTSTLGLIKIRVALTDIKSVGAEVLQQACILSELAYHSPEMVQVNSLFLNAKKHALQGFPVVVSGTESTDPQAVLWRFTDTSDLYIAFRGQHDLDKVYYSLGIGEKSSIADSSETVHSSFLKTFMELEPTLRPVIEAELNSVTRIILTGHGLGGAIATIAAPFIAELFPDEQVQCYTFGSPMVGGRDFNDWFKQKVNRAVRIVCSSDPVPYLPLGREDFKHPVDAVCITRSGFCEAWSSNVKPSPEVLDGIERIDFDEWRWQQSCQKYKRRISEAVSRSNRRETSKSFVTPVSKARGA